MARQHQSPKKLSQKQQPSTKLAPALHVTKGIHGNSNGVSKALFEGAVDPIIIVDLNHNTYAINPAAEKLFGYKAKSLLGKPFPIHDGIAEDVFQAWIKKCRTGQGISGYETERRTKNGQLIPVSISVSPIFDESNQLSALSLWFKDITIQKQAEETLRQREEEFRSIFQNANDIILFINPHGKVIQANKRIEDILGFKPDEVVNKHFSKLGILKPKDLPQILKLFKERIKSGRIDEVESKKTKVFQIDLRHKDGHIVSLEASTKAIKKNKKIIGLLSIIRDVTERNQTEDELINNKYFIEKVARTAPNFIYVIDVVNGKYLYVNDIYESFFGCSKDKILGEDGYRFVQSRVHPDDMQEVMIKQNSIIAKMEEPPCAPEEETVYEFEYRLKDKNDEWRWLHSWGVVFETTPDNRISQILGIANDITEKKRVESERSKTFSLLEAALDSTADGLLIVNDKGKMVSFNDQFKKMWRIPDSILETRDDDQALNFVLEQLEKPEQFLNKVKELYAKPKAESYDILTFKDGRTFERYSRPQKIANKIVGRVWSFRDISERKHADNALLESEERYRKFFEDDLSGIFITTPDGRLLDCNLAFAQMMGFDSIAKAKQTNMYELYPNHKARDQYLEILKQKRKIQNYEEQLLGPGGQVRHIIENVLGVFDENNELIQIRGYIFDITEHKRLEEELARAQRLESAGRVAGQIAHDFNNLLAPLTAYPGLLKERMQGDDRSFEMLQDMEASAKRIAEINQQLLALGRRGHYAMEPLDLNDLIKKVISACSLPKEIIVETNLASDLFFINGGSAQLTRALTNIVANAKEAMSDIGVLTVETANIYLDKPLGGYQTIERGEYVKLEISDTGSGINSENLNRIFEPFFSTKSMDRIRGSGLGLSIVHGIIEDHKGYITVNTTLGQKTSFVLYFPISRRGIIKNQTPALSACMGSEKVLLVDDDPVQRKVGKRLLAELGYQIQTVATGEEAIELVKKEQFDLLILDMVMEGLDGTETLRQVLKINPVQKAIILSGYAMSQRVEEALRLGAGSFVSKPITMNTLATAVRHELDNLKRKARHAES